MKPVPIITLQLGGKERHLKLDLNAMVEFEELSGKNVWTMGKDGLRASELRLVLWCCLRHEDSQLKLSDVGSWFDAGNIEELAKRILEGMKLVLPESKKGAGSVRTKSG